MSEEKPVPEEKPEQPAAEASAAEDAKPAEEAKPAAEAKPADEAKSAAEAKPADEAKPAGEAKPAEEAKPAAEAKPAGEKPAEGQPAAPGAAAPAAPAPAEPERHGRRPRPGKHIPAGIAHIKATFNNTAVSITDARGGVIAWCNAGRAGFKGSRKSTAFAATMVGQDAARQALAKGMHEVEVRVQGAGAGRESAVRALQSSGMTITVIKDVTPIPHNGCRPRKRRRV